ncbi:structural maintenance of chromosomes flexible hinge domain protein [Perilla frutescens var. frutescens]|nr:structural maintenance of chromosomes flexible hinge domain protein [Perilla frutescens var. frutescens]
MVVKIMRWRPWPPLISKTYEVTLNVKRLEGGDWVHEATDKDNGGLAVEIRWKGPKIALGSFRRSVKRNCTREEMVKRVDGPNDAVLVEWDEEFKTVCSLSGPKENVFHPWEISFTVLHGLSQGAKNKISIVGSASLNLAEYASKPEENVDVKIPLIVSGIAVECHPMLCISFSLLELIAVQEPAAVVQSPVMSLPSSSASGETCVTEKDEVSALKAGLRKVKIFTEYVSTRRAKKACLEEEGSEGRCSAKSEDGEYAYPFDSDSLEEYEEGESDEGKEDSAVRKSFSYGTLAFANYAGVSCYSSARINNEDEDLIYYSNRRRSDVGCSRVEDLASNVAEQQVSMQNSKRSILPWRKRKLSFRSPKAKGEPLLKKSYGEEGGDDIDFDRRQLSSDECASLGWLKTDEDSYANRTSVSEFGDDNFAVGTWEQKEIISRDGHLKIQTDVFFASIDQRSERAAGESACTALVAVIADWLQNNHDLMPIKSQFDTLIRDGSLEWRNLCENETYRERFPDKHFDLETVIQAKIRDLCVVPEKSFIGFFHPDGMEEGNFDFLHGAMSFDNIWDEMTCSESNSNGYTPIFIVSWNDHFFILKVETDAYYIIDTLGERLHEGCNQAYILKFDRSTTIYKLPSTSQSAEEKPAAEQLASPAVLESQNVNTQPMNLSHNCEEGTPVTGNSEPMKNEQEEEVVCQGKESCKEYIKSFLAAIPIRELQADMKKGLTTSTPLHRLQIEFHFTQAEQPASSSPAMEVVTCSPQEVC